MFRAESDVDVTIHSDEESDADLVEDYHIPSGSFHVFQNKKLPKL